MEKNNFETLAENKTEFLTRLALDDNIAKCMINTNKSFKDNTVTQPQKFGLIYTHIFPYMKTTGTMTVDGSYITMKFKYRRQGDAFKAANVIFYILCSETVIQTSYQILRTDYLLQQVDRLINDTRNETWLGKMTFDGMDDIVDSTGNYIGISVAYKNTEFQ